MYPVIFLHTAVFPYKSEDLYFSFIFIKRIALNIPAAGGVSSTLLLVCPFHHGSLLSAGGLPGNSGIMGGECELQGFHSG